MNLDFLDSFKKSFSDFLVTAGIKIIYVVIAIFVGLILIRFISNLINKILEKSKTEAAFQTFIKSLSKMLLYLALFFVIGLIFGIKASAFLTLLGAAGIAVGLALQGSLSNFAGGVLILLFKPFKVDDKVIINGVFGEIDSIDILYTRIRTWDGKIITMPNGRVANNDVENRSTLPNRRVEIDLWMDTKEDFDQIRALLTEAMAKHDRLVKGEPIEVWLQEFHNSATMRLSARCWTPTIGFWGVYWDQIEVIKKTLEANDIKFALPKTEIHYPEGVEKK